MELKYQMKLETDTQDHDPFMVSNHLLNSHKSGNISLLRTCFLLSVNVWYVFKYMFLSGFFALSPKTFSGMIKASEKFTVFAKSCLWICLLFYIPFSPLILIYITIVSICISIVTLALTLVSAASTSFFTAMMPVSLVIGGFFKKLWFKN